MPNYPMPTSGKRRNVPKRKLHPLIDELRTEAEEQLKTNHFIAAASGLGRDVIDRWFHGRHMPGLGNAQAVANVLGLEFVLVPIDLAREIRGLR